MDPISIVTLSGGVAKLCYQTATTLFKFARDTRDVDDSLDTFATEITSLSLILRGVTATLNDPILGFEKIWRSEASNQDVWSALEGSIENLKRYLDRLRFNLDEISQSEADKTLFNQAIKAFELRIKKDGVDNLRSVLRTHQLSLNTALVMVQLYTQAHLPNQRQPDLRPKIKQLRFMADELSPSTKDSHWGTAEHQHISENIEHIKRVSKAVISNASEKAESSNGSDYDTTFDPERVQQWLQLSRISEIPPSEQAISNKISYEIAQAMLPTSYLPSQSEMSSPAISETSRKANGEGIFTYNSSGIHRPLKSATQATLTRRKLSRSISDSYVPTRGTSFSAIVYKERINSKIEHRHEDKALGKHTNVSRLGASVAETIKTYLPSQTEQSLTSSPPPPIHAQPDTSHEKPPLTDMPSSDSAGSQPMNAKIVDAGYQTTQPPEYASKTSRYSPSSHLCSSADLKTYDRDEGCCMRFRLILVRFIRLVNRGSLTR